MAMNHQLCMAHSVHKSHGHFKQRVSGFKSQGGWKGRPFDSAPDEASLRTSATAAAMAAPKPSALRHPLI